MSPSNAAGEALAAHAKEAVVPSISTGVVQDVGACPKSLSVFLDPYKYNNNNNNNNNNNDEILLSIV